MRTSARSRALFLVSAIAIAAAASTRLHADTGTCGGQMITLPFTDVMSNQFFCQIAEAYFTGLTNGTSATTYSPSDPVLREQMAAFVTRTMDQTLKRGSRRAALGQFWTTMPLYEFDLGVTNLGGAEDVRSDGTDIWVAEGSNGHVSRIHASDGTTLGFWGIDSGFKATSVLCAIGKVFVTGAATGSPGRLYMVDPGAAPGTATMLTSALGEGPAGIAFDGHRIWTANRNSVSIVTRTGAGTSPWIVSDVTGFTILRGIVYDGTNVWVTDSSGLSGILKKLDPDGNVLQEVPVGDGATHPVFDGKNIWVPNLLSVTVTVVRAATGEVLATLSGNGLNDPIAGAFDGERMLITSIGNDNLSLWKAADLTPLGNSSLPVNARPTAACSDGLYFWIALAIPKQLARF